MTLKRKECLSSPDESGPSVIKEENQTETAQSSPEISSEIDFKKQDCRGFSVQVRT